MLLEKNGTILGMSLLILETKMKKWQQISCSFKQKQVFLEKTQFSYFNSLPLLDLANLSSSWICEQIRKISLKLT